jgi:SAM-dependent methyltransferase
MNTRNCPVCGTTASIAIQFMRSNFDLEKLSSFSFSSRKLPEFMCHELVQCPQCDLVYVPNPPDQSVLSQAYHLSDFDSSQEADDAAHTYLKATKGVLERIKYKGRALEIGTGTGIFLEKLKDVGFEEVVGVEPSTAAIKAAPLHRQKWIREGVFNEFDFEPQSFDFICCFMTLEHVRDPQDLVLAAYRLLRPGGAIALVTHDYRSSVNRILGSRSPIIDIEHMQLFSKPSIQKILENNGFLNVHIASFRNRYELKYWLRLMPFGQSIMAATVQLLKILRLADLKLSFNVGNIISTGFRG